MNGNAVTVRLAWKDLQLSLSPVSAVPAWRTERVSGLSGN